MDYAAAKVLKRIDTPLNEDRRKALERAEDIFGKIASGAIGVESWSEDGEADEGTRAATAPAAAKARPERLLD